MKALTVIVSIIFCISCSSVKPIEQTAGESYAGSVNIGDRIIIETKEGRSHKFTVSDVAEEFVRGNGHTVPFNEIAELHKAVPSKAKTVTAFAVGALVALVASAAGNTSRGGP